LRDTFQEQIPPKAFEIDMDKKLRIKFSAFNVDFDGSSHDFLGSKKPAHEVTKRYYFTVVDESFVKTVADGHGHATYHNKH